MEIKIQSSDEIKDINKIDQLPFTSPLLVGIVKGPYQNSYSQDELINLTIIAEK